MTWTKDERALLDAADTAGSLARDQLDWARCTRNAGAPEGPLAAFRQARIYLMAQANAVAALVALQTTRRGENP